MRLYHGTNTDFEVIELEKSNPHKDFGRGFYLTDIREQAERLATKKAGLWGGVPVVQEYEFDERLLTDGGLKVLAFETPTAEWAEFVFRNRNRELSFTHDYDIVRGPIADDGVAYLLGRYEEQTLTLDELSRALAYRELNNQYFFGTEKALKHLHRI